LIIRGFVDKFEGDSLALLEFLFTLDRRLGRMGGRELPLVKIKDVSG